MENRWITIETIGLIFAILFAWILNGFSVFLPYWIITNPPIGIIPIGYQIPGYLIAVTSMMMIAFVAFFLMAGFFTFAVVSYYILHKNKATRIGYTIVSIVSSVAASFQILSFILMEICWNDICTNGYGSINASGLSACPYLALVSGIINLLIVPPAIHLSKTDFEKKETTQWTIDNSI